VYIHPYPKSLALRFHDDAIVIDPADETPGKVRFEPFVGVAPRRYLEWFTTPERRATDGERLPREPGIAAKTLREPVEMPLEESEVATEICSSCEKANPLGASYCVVCGTPITVTESDAESAGKEDAGEATTLLSDPMIRFQESLKVESFRKLLAEKGVRLKEEM
jgi:hypothetical protein